MERIAEAGLQWATHTL